MMETIVPGLMEAGIAVESIHFEAFGPSGLSKVVTAREKKSSQPATPSSESTTIEVQFGKEGPTHIWDGSHETLLEFAESNGISLDSGCRVGNCGQCAIGLTRGKVSTTIEPDASIDADQCLACISVPEESIQLELTESAQTAGQ